MNDPRLPDHRSHKRDQVVVLCQAAPADTGGYLITQVPRMLKSDIIWSKETINLMDLADHVEITCSWLREAART